MPFPKSTSYSRCATTLPVSAIEIIPDFIFYDIILCFSSRFESAILASSCYFIQFFLKKLFNVVTRRCAERFDRFVFLIR